MCPRICEPRFARMRRGGEKGRERRQIAVAGQRQRDAGREIDAGGIQGPRPRRSDRNRLRPWAGGRRPRGRRREASGGGTNKPLLPRIAGRKSRIHCLESLQRHGVHPNLENSLSLARQKIQ
jgi:hypothetical protein